MNNDKTKVHNDELMLKDDEESRGILWYSAFLKPLRNYYSTTSAANIQQQSQARSLVMKLMLDELKRPARDAEGVERNERHQFGDKPQLGRLMMLSRTPMICKDLKQC